MDFISTIIGISMDSSVSGVNVDYKCDIELEKHIYF